MSAFGQKQSFRYNLSTNLKNELMAEDKIMEKVSREDQEKLDKNVQMMVGISALKKVAHIAHEIKRDDENNMRLVKRIIMFTVIFIALAIVIFIVFPHMGLSVLRTVAANLH
jgi:hypothetical protein